MIENKTVRESNIELLRIILMGGVILLHMNNPLIGAGFSYSQGLNKGILYFLESFSACAVDLFMLLSGYFLFVKDKRNLWKPIRLIVQVIIFAVILYFVKVIIGNDSFSVNGLIGSLIPRNYFVILYITVFLVSPLINRVVKNTDIAYLKKFFILAIIVFSIYPTFVDLFTEITHREWTGMSTIGMYGSQWGYTFVNFALMYFIGAYLKRQEEFREQDNKKVYLVLKILGVAVLLTLWAYLNDFIGFETERSAWEYCNPLIIYEATLIFRLFKQIHLRSKIINRLAKASFTVFLLQNVFISKLPVQSMVESNAVLMILYYLATIICIYIACWLIHEIYQFVSGIVFAKLEKRKLEI